MPEGCHDVPGGRPGVLDLEVAEPETGVDQAGGCDEPTDPEGDAADVLTAAEQLLGPRQVGQQGPCRPAAGVTGALLQSAGQLRAAFAPDAVRIHGDSVVGRGRREAGRRERHATELGSRRQLAVRLPRLIGGPQIVSCPQGRLEVPLIEHGQPAPRLGIQRYRGRVDRRSVVGAGPEELALPHLPYECASPVGGARPVRRIHPVEHGEEGDAVDVVLGRHVVDQVVILRGAKQEASQSARADRPTFYHSFPEGSGSCDGTGHEKVEGNCYRCF